MSDVNPDTGSSVQFALGTVAASEALIADVYLRLRSDLFRWATLTGQTPQPRMGYIGQHLTSVVTGHRGGGSGGRGKDLVLASGGHAEIKTCYRVDQLGTCRTCGATVPAILLECPACGSSALLRKADSKWLLAPKHDAEFAEFFEPQSYYFVLFDFEDLADPTVINARIWEVDPKQNGFVYCMIDYYENIRTNSASAAPFNLWPFSLKFQLMEPTLIYHAVIDADESITTVIFPGERGSESAVDLDKFTNFSGTTGFTNAMITELADKFSIPVTLSGSRVNRLAALQQSREESGFSNHIVVDLVAEAMYRDRIAPHFRWLPHGPAAV